MFITKECDYAVRVVRALGGGEKLSVPEICRQENITVPFAYKILKKLQEAGIVKGHRGVQGGYTIKIPASELTLLKVYNAIDPNMFVIDCLNPEKQCERNGPNDGPCLVHRELAEIQQEFLALLERKSLAQILAGE